MRQWYPHSGSARPGPDWEWEATAPPVAGADDYEYTDDGWDPVVWETPAAGADEHRYARSGADLVEATQAFPALADYRTQPRHSAPAPRQESAPPAFSQQFCEVSRVVANGNLQPGLPGVDFLVRIVGGWLTVIEIPVIPVFSVPTEEVQITTPLWQRKIGTGSIVRLAGQLWSIEFVRVHQAEVARADRGGFLRTMFTAGTARKAVHRGREINARFTATLLAAGADDTIA
ncbi:MAG: hypothetical protein ACRDOL_14360 [Streptosporangiaceae bacterium]